MAILTLATATGTVLCRIQHVEEDSWEDVLDAELGTGLVDLQQLLWPDMPYSQRRYMEQHVIARPMSTQQTMGLPCPTMGYGTRGFVRRTCGLKLCSSWLS